jgi:aminoglycoside 2'-N-acetyltransferase I
MERHSVPDAAGAGVPDALRIETCRTADLTAEERAAVVDLCSWAHQVDFGGLFSLLPPDGMHVFARLDADLVSHAVITTRWLQPDSLRFLRCAYVDAVATAPTHQRRGVGHAVMRRLAEAAGTDGFQIGCLESELRGFYEPLGWERWRGPLAAQTDAGVVPTPDQEGIFILRLSHTPTLDVDGPLTIRAAGRFW